MRTLIFCQSCIQEGNVKGALATTVVNDDGHYFHQCDFGHKTVIISQNMKFERLFDYGASAIIDGYYREGVLSFTASLERFYEYFIKVVMDYKNIESSIIERLWKDIKNQSERQLGAFIAAYSICFGERPEIMDSDSYGFRNKVAHKGYIPSEDEAINYGQKIMSLIIQDIIKLKTNCLDQVHNSIREKVQQGNKFFEDTLNEYGAIDHKSTMGENTILSIINDQLSIGDLRQKLTQLQVQKQSYSIFPKR